MQFKNHDYLAVGGAAGILIASFLAFASTKSGGGFVSITHMPALFYLLPVLGLCALGLAIATLIRKVTAPPANLVLGAVTLVLAIYTGIQATGQLEAFVYQQYAFQAERDKFDAEFKARREAFNKSFENFGRETSGGMAEAQPAAQAHPAPVMAEKPIVIADADKATFGAGFYVAVLACLLFLGSGLLLQKEAKNNQSI